jgi:hypothetical protein
MAINLPQDGYEAMVLINGLANQGHVAGVSYRTKKEGGKCVLKSITAHIGSKIEVNIPGEAAMARSGMMKLAGNGGEN